SLAYAEGDKAAQATSSGAAASAAGGTASASADADGSAMFKALDKNNDGFISREEAKGSPHEQEFDKLDKNGDGKLSREVLAAALERYKDRDDVVVLALPRGGVPVGYEVAKRLGAPLDVFVVRKLGVPGHRELAMGAIAPGGVRVLNRSIVDWYHIPPQAIEETAREELAELERREHAYRGARGPLEVAGKTVILVDDGLATGSTMKAAV